MGTQGNWTYHGNNAGWPDLTYQGYVVDHQRWRTATIHIEPTSDQPRDDDTHDLVHDIDPGDATHNAVAVYDAVITGTVVRDQHDANKVLYAQGE